MGIKKNKKNNFSINDICVHYGNERKKPYDSLITPIYQTSTFVFQNAKDIMDYTSGKKFRYEYGRYGNPTQKILEQKIAKLDKKQDCIVMSSGMSAVTNTFLALLKKSDHLIITSDVYKKTLSFCEKYLTKFGIEFTVVPPDDFGLMEKSVKQNTKLIFSETPTNPYLNIIDLEKFAKIAKKYKLISVIDSTFATPINQTPADFGIDIIIHSLTKYIAGHNDVLGGSVSADEKYLTPILDYHKTVGTCLDAYSCFLIDRGLKTLPIRVEKQNKTALEVAKYLEKHKKIHKIYYPGLKSHPQYKIAKKQMHGFGGVVSFRIKGGKKEAIKLINNFQHIYIAPSLGGTESLITHPLFVSYYDLPLEKNKQLGITYDLFRLAVGLENPEDIILDLDRALSKI